MKANKKLRKEGMKGMVGCFEMRGLPKFNVFCGLVGSILQKKNVFRAGN